MAGDNIPDVVRTRKQQAEAPPGTVSEDLHSEAAVASGVYVYENPTNGHREEVGGMLWLWTLLFGWIYLLVKGLVVHVLVWLAIAFTGFLLLGEGGFVVLIALNIIYAANVQSLLRASYLRKGWIEVEYGRASDVAGAQPQQQASAPVSVADEIQKLANLRDTGLLTDAEFQQQKKKLLG